MQSLVYQDNLSLRDCNYRPRTVSPFISGLSVVALCASWAFAQPDPSGIDFVTIGALNNPAYAGPDSNNIATGRGSINYLYKIGRTEVTTGQWMEFYNTFYSRTELEEPYTWGARFTGNLNQPFELIPGLEQSANIAVSGIDWRTCAKFCNWLHNDKRSDLSAIANGAYDTSTFGYNGNRFTDQYSRNPDAKYWIPSLDERMKAVYYDPNQANNGQNGWFTFGVNGTNTPPIYGPPGSGQANSRFENSGNERFIPLGSYPEFTTPWGLLDVAGCTAEWTETVVTDPFGLNYRRFAGSSFGFGGIGADRIYSVGGTFPTDVASFFGLRIAAAVPNTGTGAVIFTCLCISSRRRRRT